MEGWRAGGGSDRRVGWCSYLFGSIKRWVMGLFEATKCPQGNCQQGLSVITFNNSNQFDLVYPVVPVLLVSHPCQNRLMTCRVKKIRSEKSYSRFCDDIHLCEKYFWGLGIAAKICEVLCFVVEKVSHLFCSIQLSTSELFQLQELMNIMTWLVEQPSCRFTDLLTLGSSYQLSTQFSGQ